MYILSKTKSEAGQYQAIKTWAGLTAPDGFYWWPDYLKQDTFKQYEGFVILTIKRNTVASYVPNEEAYAKWKEEQPGPDPEPGMSAYATWDELAKAWREGVNAV